MVASLDEIAAQTDQLVPTPAGHDGPAWPHAPARHCPTCATRRSAGFTVVYGSRDLVSLAPAPLARVGATAAVGRFSALHPQLTALALGRASS